MSKERNIARPERRVLEGFLANWELLEQIKGRRDLLLNPGKREYSILKKDR